MTVNPRPISETHTTAEAQAGEPPRRPQSRLMLAEPEPLLRWSLASYLQRWFEVIVVQTLDEACEVAEHSHVDAAVVSDAWPAASLDLLETQLEKQVADVRIVRLVTDQGRTRPSRRRESLLEKPFQLVDLARRLGITPSRS